jgi:mannitol/fructose-specific phosphotransferase system IIA component (Ntr-type)
MPQGTPFRIELAHLTLGLDAKTAGEAVELLTAALGEGMDEGRKRQLASLVMAREAEASTYIGHSTALPHARTSLVSRLTIAACVMKEPVAWDDSGDKVRLMFLMAIPKTAIEEYLQAVRTLTHVFRKPGAVEKLCAAADAGAFLTALEGEIALTSTPDRA